MEHPHVGPVDGSPNVTVPVALTERTDASHSAAATIVPKAISTPFTRPAGTFPLLWLAPELRERVFECFFASSRFAVRCGIQNCEIDCHYSGTYEDDEDEMDYDYNAMISRLAITKVSKSIRYESIAAMLRVGRFDFSLLDSHPTWIPEPLLKVQIGRMKHLYGPPRLLHFLNLTTLPYCVPIGVTAEESRWMHTCGAENVICDMIVDAFDLQDASANSNSNEGQYFQGLKDAIAGPRGERLMLSIQLQDSEPTWSGWEEPGVRSALQVQDGKVIVNKRPRTEAGKLNVKTVLELLGVELEEVDLYILDPKKQEEPMSTTTSDEDGNGNGGGDGAGATDLVNDVDVSAVTGQDVTQASSITALNTTAPAQTPVIYDAVSDWGDEYGSD